MDDIERTEKRGARPVRASPASLNAELLDQLADAVLVADTDGHYVEANLAAATLLGYSRAELMSMGVGDVTMGPPGWSQSEYVRFSKDGYWRGMVDLRRKDGSPVRVEARASVLQTPEGRWGISVLREIDEAAGPSTIVERRLAAIVQSSDDAIYSVTPDGLIESWNPAAERLYGYRAEEIVGKHVDLTAPPDRRDEVAHNTQRVMAGEHLQDHETVHLTKDGRTFDVSLTISPIHDIKGKVSGMSTTARDITDRKRAEERAQELARALEEARDTLQLVTLGAPTASRSKMPKDDWSTPTSPLRACRATDRWMSSWLRIRVSGSLTG